MEGLVVLILLPLMFHNFNMWCTTFSVPVFVPVRSACQVTYSRTPNPSKARQKSNEASQAQHDVPPIVAIKVGNTGTSGSRSSTAENLTGLPWLLPLSSFRKASDHRNLTVAIYLPKWTGQIDNTQGHLSVQCWISKRITEVSYSTGREIRSSRAVLSSNLNPTPTSWFTRF